MLLLVLLGFVTSPCRKHTYLLVPCVCLALSQPCGFSLFLSQDKKYASDKYKDIYTELSIVKAKADCDISRLKEQLKAATEALGEKSPENTTVSGYGQSLRCAEQPHSLPQGMQWAVSALV